MGVRACCVWAGSQQLCLTTVLWAHVPITFLITAVSVIRTASSPPLLQQQQQLPVPYLR